MISSPNRHSPIGIAARRFGGYFSAGALTAMTSMYCRRVQSLHSFICGVGPSGFEKLKKSENETSEFSIQKHIRIWTCPPSRYTIVCGRAGVDAGGAAACGYRAPVAVGRTASRQPAAGRRATRPATIHRRRGVAGSESDMRCRWCMEPLVTLTARRAARSPLCRFIRYRRDRWRCFRNDHVLGRRHETSRSNRDRAENSHKAQAGLGLRIYLLLSRRARCVRSSHGASILVTGSPRSHRAVTGRAAELTIPRELVAAHSRLALAYAVPSLRHGWCPTAPTSQLRLHSSDFTAPTSQLRLHAPLHASCLIF